jgi:hypothetical protein
MKQLVLLFLLLAGISSALAQSLTAPDAAKIGSQITVAVAGSNNPRNLVTIVAKGAREGAYGDYQYARQATVSLRAPPTPGEYEIRLLGADSPYPTLARRALEIEGVGATLDAPAQVESGKRWNVRRRSCRSDRATAQDVVLDPRQHRRVRDRRREACSKLPPLVGSWRRYVLRRARCRYARECIVPGAQADI